MTMCMVIEIKAYIQRRDCIVAWSVILSVMAQTQLQKKSYRSLPFCADLLISEINYWAFKQ
jgi:hypothetical protein